MTLPGAEEERATLGFVVVAGWAQPEEAVAECCQLLEKEGPVETVLLNETLPALTQSIVKAWSRVHARADYCLLVGWSLGGAVLVKLLDELRQDSENALLFSRLAGVSLIASNPCFVAKGDWPGVQATLFDEFERELLHAPESLILRFNRLQMINDPDSRALIRRSRPWATEAAKWPLKVLAEGLVWLAQWDLREQLSAMPWPVQHLLGEGDTLVPEVIASRLPSNHQVSVLEGCGHYLMPHAAPRVLAWGQQCIHSRLEISQFD